jgi:serine/threonine protein kinase/WD40 repeat protein
MQDRDLIVGVLAAQAGFATPSEVLTAAAAGLVDSAPDSLLTRLERAGTLSIERRKILEALVEQTMAARRGDARAVLESLGATPEVLQTLTSAVAPPPTDGRPPAPVPDIPIERPGQYTRLRELGRGSQSIVRAARDELVGREVALKELVVLVAPAKDDSSRAARARFVREVRLVASLDHPGIVTIHELARREDGTLFCAQKLIRGATLQARLTGCRSLGERLTLLRHVLDACQAMGFAHSKHVIHRDLKPSNVMVGEHGETVVVDWGLAKHRDEAEDVVPLIPSSPEPELTVAGVAIGTPAYMSPEQAAGDLAAIDARSDVFSLGSILYQVLTGRPPFEGATSDQIMEKVRAGDFLPVRALTPGAPPELAAISERALQPRPSERYRDAQELAAELSAYLSGGRVRAYRYGSWELLRRFVSANRALSAVSAAGLLILVAAAGIIAHQLQITRANLAQSFIDRARAAGATADWARAAGYYAASRMERESDEARWGYALAAERVSPRASVRSGPPGAYLDVAPLSDGRLITLGRQKRALFASDLESGKELWRTELPDGAQGISLRPRQLVTMASASPRHPLLPNTGRSVLDAATGSVLASLDNSEGIPCSRSPFPAPVLVSSAGLVTVPPAGETSTVLSATVDRESRCIVTDDGRQVAFDDARGLVHLWSLVDRREIGARVSPDVREIVFTAHGLALIRPTSIHVFGGSEGDFFVEIPRGSGTSPRPRPGGIAVSRDGHRLVFDRGSGYHLDLIDLQSRSILTSFSFVPGEPRLAFSPEGDRVFAAGLLGASNLSSWEIRGPVPRKSFSGSPRMFFQTSRDGQKILVYLGGMPARRWELYDVSGTRRLSGPLGERGELALTPDGKRVVIRDDDGLSVLDAESGRVAWRVECKECFRVVASAEGRRLFTSSGKRLALWAVGSPDPIWTDGDRVGNVADGMAISDDGSRVAWINGTTAYVHRVDSPTELEATFDENVSDLKFSNDGKRLLIATRGEIALWTLDPWKRAWRVPSPASSYASLEWSTDDSVLLAEYRTLGTVLLDAATGRHLATVPLSKPRSVSPEDKVLPSLKGRISQGDGRWELWSFPEPDHSAPRESLARITSATGLKLVGAELVDSVPGATGQ